MRNVAQKRVRFCLRAAPVLDFAEMGTPQKQVRYRCMQGLNPADADVGTLRGGAGAETGTPCAQAGDGRPKNVLDSAWITGFCQAATHTAGRGASCGAETGTLSRRKLWKSLWNHGVIPAESGSGKSLKRVRPAADSGSGLRRNEYGCAQNRVRGGRLSALESSTYTSRIRFTSS